MFGIAYWIEKRAGMSPSRVALIGENQQYTYLEMNELIHSWAKALSHPYSLQPGERIAILSSNTPEYLILLFAIAKIECIAVPLNTRLSTKELEYQINDSGARLIIAGKGHEPTARELMSITCLQDCLSMNDLLEKSAKMDEEALENLISAAEATVAPNQTPNQIPGSKPFIICYTSGKPISSFTNSEQREWISSSGTKPSLC